MSTTQTETEFIQADFPCVMSCQGIEPGPRHIHIWRREEECAISGMDPEYNAERGGEPPENLLICRGQHPQGVLLKLG